MRLVTERVPGKPHFILTAGKQPTPPAGAKGYNYMCRFETGRRELHNTIMLSNSCLRFTDWGKQFRTPGQDIIAVRWMA